MRGKILTSLIIFSFVFLLLQAGFGQTEEDSGEIKKDGEEKTIVDDTKKELDEKKPAPVKESIKEKPASTKKLIEKEKSVPDKEAARKETKEEEKIKRDDAIDSGLLEIVEGDFKYSRIPEIKIPERILVNEERTETKRVEGKESKDTLDEKGKKGLFGLSRKTTDLVAKGILILIIVVIFILYRARSKDKRSKVLRRFPKV
jgi:hypothetical protein